LAITFNNIGYLADFGADYHGRQQMLGINLLSAEPA